MPEWLIEGGIGETRAALVENGEIIEARIELEGAVRVGTVLEARLMDIGQAGRNAAASDSLGREYLLPKSPTGVTQGSTIRIEVTREHIPGAENWKRARARTTDGAIAEPRSLPGRELTFPPHGRDELADAGWGELIEEAASGEITFDGGRLNISLTPAMTLIDVDGWGAPEQLSVSGAAAAARAIRRLDIGGSIGIDLPTVKGKAERQRAGEAIDAVLLQPFERTAMNGFGFLQLVRPRLRASLPEILADRAPAEARALLRRVALERTGPTRLAAHPAVVAVLEQRDEWLDDLARQIGGPVTLRSDASIPIHGAYAESP